MPDVGTLNITIQSDAEQAATGLRNLAGALSDIQKAAPNGLNLAGIAGPLNKFAKTVGDNSKTLSNIGTFLNAVTNYTTAFKKLDGVKFNSQPIDQLKAAIGDGIKIGQAGTQINNLRIALGGEWNTDNASKASAAMATIAQGAQEMQGKNLGTIAKGVSALAKALDEYATSAERIKSAVGGNAWNGQNMLSSGAYAESKETGENVPEGLGEGVRSRIDAVVSAVEELVHEAMGTARKGFGIASPSKEFKIIGEYIVEGMIEGILSKKKEIQNVMADLAKSLTGITKETVGSSGAPGDWRGQMMGLGDGGKSKNSKQSSTGIISSIKELTSALQGASGLNDYAQGLAAIASAIDSGAKSYHTLGYLATAFEKLKTAFNGFKTPDFSRLENFARTLQENYGLEISLVRIAKGMEAIKAAGAGFKMPNVKGIEKVIDAMNGTGTQPAQAQMNESSSFVGQMQQLDEQVQSTRTGLEAMNEELSNTLVDFSKIPASGENGAFASASEEIEYLRSQIEQAKADMQSWDNVYSKTQKQIKYNGATEERTNMLGHAEEGYYAAYERLEQLQSALASVTDYAARYAESVRESTSATTEQADVLTRAANAADDLQAKMSGVESVTSQAAETARTTGQYWRSLDDVISNLNVSNLWGAQLRGQFGEREQFVALNTAADTFGMTITDVRARVDAFIASLQSVSAPVNGASGALIDVSGTMQTSGGASDQLKGKLKDLDKELKTKKTDVNGVDGAFKKFGAGLKAMFPTISGLLKRFKSMIIMRSMRYMIREISKGFSEGIQNVYHYSNAIGGSFATSMDNAASSLLTMKNSIGAAVAPVIQALIPYLQTVVNWFISLVNYANQFFALLNGQSTWTHAVDATTTAFENQTNAAHNASNAVKDLLADWDELNIIQSESGNGGSNSGVGDSTDYTTMFEEVTEFDENIKRIVSSIKEQFGSILGLIGEIGTAILLWKVSNAFAGTIATIAGIAGSVATLLLTFQFVSLFADNYMKTGDVGWLIGNVLTTLLGSVFTKKILSKVLGAKAAAIAIPLTLFVSAFANARAVLKNTDVDALSKENLITSILSATEVGGGVGYLLYKAGGYTAGYSAATGAGVTLTTFGVLLGLKATKGVIDTGEITKDTILADLLSAGSVGGGLAFFATAAGVGLSGTLALATGGAILMFGALIGIQAILSLEEKNGVKIKWGSYVATEKEIKAFVKDQVFTVDADSILKLTDPEIQVATEKEEELKTSVDKITVEAKKISLTYDTKESLNALETEIFGENKDGEGGLLGKFKETAKAYQNVIETGLTLVPVADENGTRTIIDTTGEGWELLTKHMDDLGTDLAKHFGTAYSENIDEETRKAELQTIEDITMMMANVASAITNGEQYEQAIMGLEANINNLSQGSYDAIFDYIAEFRKSIVDGFTKAYDETTVKISGQAAGLKAAMENALKLANGDTNDPTYKEYKEEYERVTAILEARRAGREDAINNATNGAIDPETKKVIRDAFMRQLDFVIDDSVIDELSNSQIMYNLFGSMFDVDGNIVSNAEEKLTHVFDNIIENAIGEENFKTVKKMLEQGFLSYGDFIDTNTMAIITKSFGIDETSEAFEEWNNLVKKLFGEGQPNKTTVFDTVDGGIKTAQGAAGDFLKLLELIGKKAEEANKAKEKIDASNEGTVEIFDGALDQLTDAKEKIKDAMASGMSDDSFVSFLLGLDEQYGHDVVSLALEAAKKELKTPGLDNSELDKSVKEAKETVSGLTEDVKEKMKELSGVGFGVHATFKGDVETVPVQPCASGGFIKSGDLIMANENGNIEMMGKMGSQPVVANNQQIVSGISQGVAEANGDVVGELRTLTTLMQRMLNKEFVAKAVPGSDWGRANTQSQLAYDRVTG